MSGSSSAYSKVFWKNSQPSGSSVAIEPTSASCASGTSLVTVAVGVDHADRVLPGVEAGDLGDQRPVDVDPELVADEGGVVGREGHVLRRERVDRRRDDAGSPSWSAHPGRHVGRQVPDGRVVLLDQRLQARDRRRVRARRGRCGSARSSCGSWPAAPRRSPIGCGSWTMIVSHSPCRPVGVDRVDLVEDLPLLVAERLLGALQRVVEELGRVEELLLAEDHVPVGVEADVAHQRHDRVEDLGDAAAEGGGADVEDALCPRAARRARGSARSAPCRRCACSRRGTSGRVRLPEASGSSTGRRGRRSRGRPLSRRARCRGACRG